LAWEVGGTGPFRARTNYTGASGFYNSSDVVTRMIYAAGVMACHLHNDCQSETTYGPGKDP